MKQNHWSNRLADLDETIRKGNINEAIARLNSIAMSQVPRGNRATLGQLYIRANLPHKTLLCLNRSVRLGSKINPKATQADLLAYSLGLIRIGSAQEAKDILALLPAECAEARLYQAFSHQTMWDYPSAIPHLEAYLTLKKMTPYEKAVAEVNLTACLIQDRQFERAEEIVQRLVRDAKKENWNLLFRNSSELAAQAAVEQGKMAHAREILKTIHSGHAQVQNVADLFVAKWAAFADVLENSSAQNVASVRRVREMAKNLEHWETIRDCDRILAQVTRDSGLFTHVYFGTPFRFFRDKMLKNAERWMMAPQTYTLGSNSGPVFDLLAGEMKDGSASLRPGHIIHRTICFLLEDFYRPISLGRFYNQLFPGEYFNPESSLGRVSNLIHRTRQWIEDEGLPLEIEVGKRSFQLRITDPGFGIHFSRLLGEEKSTNIDVTAYMNRIKQQIPDSYFTCSEAAKSMDVSRSAAIRILNGAVEAGIVERKGKGRNTSYWWSGK